MIPSQPLSEPVSGTSFDPKSAIYLPLGAASPFWFLYAGAASAGVAYWWFSRWRGATNVEALFGRAAVLAPVDAAVEAVEDVVAEVAEPILEAQASISELIAAPASEPEATSPESITVAELTNELASAVEAEIEPEPLLAQAPVLEAAPEPVVETAPAKSKAGRAARAVIDDPA
ncbi:hypothetical protein [Phenylobacterium sp.]|uniref:hypothetical protein n=1 Tax=Phenylobacterium sp. TaxID=1871053 RepID=UPI00286C68FE|nr:hypothetical protein [Phenylobacterium sp.]